MKEWQTIEGFDNYEVSTLGKVRNKKSCKILKGYDNGFGYLRVDLFDNGKRATKRVHRLVAEAFIPNPLNKSDVNHINEIKTDNRADNLNWMTSEENVNYGTRNERMKNNPQWRKNNAEHMKKIHKSNSKPIYALYPDGTDEYYPSATIAAKELGLWQASITACLKGRLKTSGRLRFEYAKGN